jgi:glycosyltransferase involved in cell wall biosynthesis
MATIPDGNIPLVTFAIPVRRPTSAGDRERLDWVLAQTLRSIFQQTHGDFRVLIAAAHKPVLPDFVDERLEVMEVPGFLPPTWDDANREAGARRWALAARFAELGGGYLMHVDCDDFISRDLVAHVHATRHPNGYIVQHGYIFDAAQNLVAPYPIERKTPGNFHRFCGTSAIVRMTRDDVIGSRRRGENFYDRVYGGGHHHVFDRIAGEGRPLEELPFPAAVYVRNRGDNLSRDAVNPDGQGAHDWMAALDAAVVANRIADDAALRAEFALPERYALAPAPAAARKLPAPQPSLSVLICTHRRPEGLRRILSALVPQLGGEREVVVVNDGTHDDAYAAVAAEFTQHIRYRALRTNVGVAAARNAAARMATGDYLIFTDDDCEPPPFWLDWIAARLAEHPELDYVAGTTRPLWPKKPGFFARVRAAHDLIPTTARADGTIIFPTAVVAIRRSLFEAMGGFGFPGFVGAGEDTELATRLALRGASGVYDPSWFTRHEITEGFFGLCRRYRRYGYANGRLIRLTTSPVAHDYMQSHWQSGWRTVWRWEMVERLKAARAAHRSAAAARLSATLACLVKMAYWQGVKDSFAAP